VFWPSKLSHLLTQYKLSFFSIFSNVNPVIHLSPSQLDSSQLESLAGVLFVDPSIECDTAGHIFGEVVCGMGFLVYSLGLPILILWRSRSYTNKPTNVFLESLYGLYEDKWWPFVVLIRKLLWITAMMAFSSEAYFWINCFLSVLYFTFLLIRQPLRDGARLDATFALGGCICVRCGCNFANVLEIVANSMVVALAVFVLVQRVPLYVAAITFSIGVSVFLLVFACWRKKALVFDHDQSSTPNINMPANAQSPQWLSDRDRFGKEDAIHDPEGIRIDLVHNHALKWVGE
jgi:hypothetical protein